jgi:hypothetical protein
MKFWKLLCAAGCLGFVLILLLAYLAEGPGSATNNSDPNAPRPAPSILIPN